MYCVLFLLACFCETWWVVDSSRILVVVPAPIYSHQVVFRPFSQELVRRGHQVVVITTDPAFPPGQAPPNLTEIDLHDISYKQWTAGFQKAITGWQNDFNTQLKTAYEVMSDLFPNQIKADAVRKLLANKTQKFDLVVLEAWVYQALAFAHIFQAPAILMSTLGIEDEMYENAGAPIHPILYPDVSRTRRFNLSPWEHVKHLYSRIQMHLIQKSLIQKQDLRVKEMFGEDFPSVLEMRSKAAAQFLGLHPAWEGHRPLPHNIVHLGGLHVAIPKDLPEDIKTLMDSSKRGVIYMSFGSHANSALLPMERLNIFARVFATLPYDVIWKWKGALEGISSNVHTFPWLPQSDLLHHDKLVLFITQGGLQSTEEALRAGVPLLGIPLMLDQWLNVENYERLGIGLGLNLHTLSEPTLKDAVEILINNRSYRNNSARIGREIQDRPQSSLQRAVWWAERAIRLRSRSLPTPPPSLIWDDVVLTLFLSVTMGPLVLILVMIIVRRALRKLVTSWNSFVWRYFFLI